MTRSWTVAVVMLVSSGARAETPSPEADLGAPAEGPDAKLTLAPAIGSDLDPGPPPVLTTDTWALAGRDGDGRFALSPQFVPPLRLTLELPPVFGVIPYATTTWSPRFPSRFPATNVGAAFDTGPLRWGTRFGWSRDSEGFAITNASFVRYTARDFDLGLENVSHYVIGPEEPKLQHRAVLGSAGIHPVAELPTVRVNTSLFPRSGNAFSSVSAFGTF